MSAGQWARFDITDGTRPGTVSLLKGNKPGFHIQKWNPKIVQAKSGGVYQESSLAAGRRLVLTVDDLATETLTLSVNNHTQDLLAQDIQNLLRLLLKAREYWTNDAQDEPVYIKAVSQRETNTRYALLHNFGIPELGEVYAQPFYDLAAKIAAMDKITLTLERGHWLANPPGDSDCVQVSNQQTWSWDLAIEEVSSAPVRIVNGFARHSGGYLYATGSEDGTIYRSTNSGATWSSNVTNATYLLRGITALANDYLLAWGYFNFTGNIWRSTNNGSSWGTVSTGLYPCLDIVQTDAGTCIAVGANNQAYSAIARSTDNGGTWSNVLDSISIYNGVGFARAVIAGNGNILAFKEWDGGVYRSTDDGQNWSVSTSLTTEAGFDPMGAILASDGNLYVAGCKITSDPAVMGILYKSADYGSTWSVVYQGAGYAFASLMEDSEGNFYTVALDSNTPGGANSFLLKSTDYGQSWKYLYQLYNAAGLSVGYSIRHELFQNTDNRIYIGTGDGGAHGYIYRTTATSSTETLGPDATCTDKIMVGNRNNFANITHVKIDDGGSFSDLFPMSPPDNLLPATPAGDDALYIGINANVIDTGTFSGIVFNIGTVMSAESYDLAYEYSDGAAGWPAVSEVNDETNKFSRAGVGVISFVQPSDWDAEAIDGITAYWLRIRVDSITGPITTPSQVTDSIYAVNRAFLHVDSAQVGGDIAAIARLKLTNHSDFDGPDGDGPELYSNRIIVGSRAYDRGNNFVAYLNLSSQQNIEGVSVTVGTNSTIGSAPESPSNRKVTYNPAGEESMETRATVIFGPSIARDFYGSYHVFLRGRRTAGNSTDITLRLQVVTGSGGITFTTANQQFQTTSPFEVLDFGKIDLPVSGSFKSTDLPDTTEIRVQASAASSTPDLYLYDLILIPTDEWAGDFVDTANTSSSEIGRSSNLIKYLDIDSITDLRNDIRALVRRSTGDFITAEYRAGVNEPAFLQANADQRFWFFALQTSATGSSYSWIAPPEITHSVQVFSNPRYLALRGAR